MKDGVYFDMPAAAYHAAEALSAGVAWDLISACPAEAVYGSPFDPATDDEEEDEDAEKETRERLLGVACHLAILEPERYAQRTSVVAGFRDWRKKDAQTAKADALAAGRVPLLEKHDRLVQRIRSAMLAHPTAGALLKDGHSEASLFWNEEGVPCKARPDRLSAQAIIDVKTCASIHPLAIQRAAERDGWYLRAHWYLTGAARVGGIDPARLDMRYIFLCIRQKPPHLVKAYELGPRALGMGAVYMRDALAKFEECRRQRVWPAYGDDVGTIDPADWTEKRFFERYDADEMTPRARAMLTELVP